jgi:hypothetical protein
MNRADMKLAGWYRSLAASKTISRLTAFQQQRKDANQMRWFDVAKTLASLANYGTPDLSGNSRPKRHAKCLWSTLSAKRKRRFGCERGMLWHIRSKRRNLEASIASIGYRYGACLGCTDSLTPNSSLTMELVRAVRSVGGGCLKKQFDDVEADILSGNIPAQIQAPRCWKREAPSPQIGLIVSSFIHKLPSKPQAK